MNLHQKKRRWMLLCAILLGLPLVACGTGVVGDDEITLSQSAETSQLAASATLIGEPIRIGVLYSLSGNNAAIGANILRGVDFAVAEINALGGVDGRPIEIVRGDTQGDGETAETEAIRLITQEGAQAILGCHQSTMTEIVALVCQQYEIPMLTAISTVDSITTHENEYFFRLCPMNSLYLENMFMYMREQEEQTGQSAQTVALFVDDSMIGQEAIRCARIYAEEYGMEIVSEITYTQGTADLSTQVEALKAADADVVLAESYASDATLLLETIEALNYDPPILIGKANGFTDPGFLSATQGISEGVTSVVEWNTDMTRGQETNAQFREIFGVDMNGHSAEAYTAIWTLKTAFEQAESDGGEDVKNALIDIDIQGSFPDGPEIILPYDRINFENYQFDGVMHYNNNIYASVAIAQIQDGEYTTVWPFAYTNEKIIYDEEDHT